MDWSFLHRCLSVQVFRAAETDNEICQIGQKIFEELIFAPDDDEPILGVTTLESVGITIDQASRTLRRLPAIPLK